MEENIDFWELHQEKEDEIVPNKELSGLVLDDEFGVRWKNGSYDRRIRGDGKIKKESEPVGKYDILSSTRTFVTKKRMVEFVSKYMMMYESIADLQIKNSILIDSISDGDLTFCDTAIREAMDIDCYDVKKEAYEFFIRRLRENFIKHNQTMLNSLASAQAYAKFTGEKENTIRKWMERGKLELITISGVRFIFIKAEELMLWNAFLMEEAMAKEVCENRDQLIRLYKKLYGRKIPEPMDSVLKWSLYWGIYPESNESTSYYGKMYTGKAYAAYCAYCKDNKIDAIPLRLFSFRITYMGFKRFNGKNRGFLYWKGEEL